MKKMLCLFVFCSFCFLLFSTFTLAQMPKEINAEKELFYTKCAYCHTYDVPPRKNRTKEGWTELVNRMQSKYPEHISVNDAERIIAYLMTFAGIEAPEINMAKDPANLTEAEKKHIPVIQIVSEDMDKKLVTILVKVGEIAHPMEEKHYIQYIEIFINHRSEGKVELKPGDKPEAKFVVGKFVSGNVVAREECNVHGLWERKAE